MHTGAAALDVPMGSSGQRVLARVRLCSTTSMIRNPRRRRAFSIALLVFGGVALFLAPDHVWYGAVLLGIGVGLEVLGIVIGHGDDS